MTTTPVRCERRAAQRFNYNLPLAIRHAARELEGHGFTQDLSARGIAFYTDMLLAPGDEIELTLRMPSEITLGDSMRVRCFGQVVRVSKGDALSSQAVAVHLQRYEYLPDADALPEAAVDFRRISSLHIHRDETENPLGTRNFQGPGTPTTSR
jgi:hypothetical protein